MEELFMKPFVSLLVLGALAASGPVLAVAPSFSDQTINAQISFTDLSASRSAPGGGVAWLDFNNDDYLDLYVPSAIVGSASHLYVNNGDGTFTEIGAAAGVALSGAQSMSAAVGDFDGDGCDDLLVINGGNSPGSNLANTLFRNNYCDDGSLTFTDVTSTSGLTQAKASIVASVGDVDGDRDLDIYVGNYFPNGSASQADLLGRCQPNQLFLNDGTGTFTQVAAASGVDDVGCTLATTLTDFDQDGDLDIYVSNDFSGPGAAFRNYGNPDTIYRNLGNDSNGLPQFEAAVDINLTDAKNGMGIATGDYDNDLDFDYFTTTYAGGAVNLNVLNQNDGGNNFNNVAAVAGVQDIPTYSIIGWGAVFFDANNDGGLDLYKAVGTIGASAGFGEFFVMPNRLYVNNHDATFSEMALAAGVQGKLNTQFQYTQSRGVATADYDNDGRQDLYTVNVGTITPSNNVLVPGQHSLYHNETVTSDHWLKVSLKGDKPNHRGIGARVKVVSSGSSGIRTQLREVQSGNSHGSTSDFRPHFGLGSDTDVMSVQVTWPDGCESVVNSPAVDQIIEVVEWTCGLPNGVAGTINIDVGGVLQGATVMAHDPWSGVLRGSDISDSEGHYNLAIDSCICNMTATKTGWKIKWDDIGPGGQIWAWISNNLTFGDFTAKRKKGTISGFAIGSDGNPVAGVGITGSNGTGSNTFATTTDSNGHYEVAVLDDTYFVQGGSAPGCSSFWPDGNTFFEWLVTVNFDDKTKNVNCRP